MSIPANIKPILVNQFGLNEIGYSVLEEYAIAEEFDLKLMDNEIYVGIQTFSGKRYIKYDNNNNINAQPEIIQVIKEIVYLQNNIDMYPILDTNSRPGKIKDSFRVNHLKILFLEKRLKHLEKCFAEFTSGQIDNKNINVPNIAPDEVGGKKETSDAIDLDKEHSPPQTSNSKNIADHVDNFDLEPYINMTAAHLFTYGITQNDHKNRPIKARAYHSTLKFEHGNITINGKYTIMEIVELLSNLTLIELRELLCSLRSKIMMEYISYTSPNSSDIAQTIGIISDAIKIYYK